jgi:hypothetical protein
MKRGDFDIRSYFSPAPPSARRLIEADRDWIESWEPSIPETNVPVGGPRPQKRPGPLHVQSEVRESLLRITVLVGKPHQ